MMHKYIYLVIALQATSFCLFASQARIISGTAYTNIANDGGATINSPLQQASLTWSYITATLVNIEVNGARYSTRCSLLPSNRTIPCDGVLIPATSIEFASLPTKYNSGAKSKTICIPGSSSTIPCNPMFFEAVDIDPLGDNIKVNLSFSVQRGALIPNNSVIDLGSFDLMNDTQVSVGSDISLGFNWLWGKEVNPHSVTAMTSVVYDVVPYIPLTVSIDNSNIKCTLPVNNVAMHCGSFTATVQGSGAVRFLANTPSTHEKDIQLSLKGDKGKLVQLEDLPSAIITSSNSTIVFDLYAASKKPMEYNGQLVLVAEYI